jgi:hypothetical protein
MMKAKEEENFTQLLRLDSPLAEGNGAEGNGAELGEGDQ